MPNVGVVLDNLCRADQSARQNYNRAVQQALWRELVSWLTGRNNTLLSLDHINQSSPVEGRYVGGQVVPLVQIVGSVGRQGDFDRAFFPRQCHTKDRWLNIDQARYRRIPLPPVHLLQVGALYFVEDGHHRISVARAHGDQEIEAEVTVLQVTRPLPEEITDRQWS